MPVTKRPRGATAVHENGQNTFGRGFSRGHLAAIGLLVAGVAFVLLKPTDDTPPTDLSVASSTAGLPEPETAAPAAATEPTPVTPPEPAVEPEPEIAWVEQTVRSGDNLSLIFKRAGYSVRDVYAVVAESEHGKALERIYPGQTIRFLADADGELAQVRYVKSPLETISYAQGKEGFSSTVEKRTPEVRREWASGQITSSLFLAGQEAGLSHNVIMDLANIFGGVIDFVLDPRRGDTIHLLYEANYLDGEKYSDGDIIAASFTNQGKVFNAFRYTSEAGDTNYYNENGVSMRKAFLLAPVDFTRISSNFNLRRLHPIYKTTRPHRGTDYAASRGTPVFAAGDGRVIKAGYTNANGNYVFIQHGERYVTKYLHLHKRHVKQGQRVTQSQVIGTVGSTGAATGPHLHYEFLVDGVHRNPRTIHKQLPKAKALASSEMPRFREATQPVATELAALTQDNRVAMNDAGKKSATN